MAPTNVDKQHIHMLEIQTIDGNGLDSAFLRRSLITHASKCIEKWWRSCSFLYSESAPYESWSPAEAIFRA